MFQRITNASNEDIITIGDKLVERARKNKQTLYVEKEFMEKLIRLLKASIANKKNKIKTVMIESFIQRINEIIEINKKMKEKVKDIKSGTIGSIWKKGNKYYYFDNLGIFQLIDNAIYEIRDKETLEYLLNYNEGSDKIGEFIENEKLIKIEGEKKIEIRVKYTTFFLPFKISGLLAFILGIVIAKVSHYFREKKNAKKF